MGKGSLAAQFGKKNDSVGTPPEIIETLKKEFNVEEFFDPCPLERSEVNGLAIDWKTITFCNPPYSEIPRWIEKGLEEMKKGIHSLFLIPARVSSVYWRDFVFPNASRIFFLQGKVQFVGYSTGCPTAICVVEFDPSVKGNKQYTTLIGPHPTTVIDLIPERTSKRVKVDNLLN